MAKKPPRIRRTFTPQFKKDAVALVEAGRSVNEVAHDLGTWNVFFGPVHLGWLDERDYRIHDRRGRTEGERHLLPIR